MTDADRNAGHPSTNGSGPTAELARKLDLRVGDRVAVLDVDYDLAILLVNAIAQARAVSGAVGDDPADAVFFMPKGDDATALPQRFKEVSGRVGPSGAVWALSPKKPYAAERGVGFTWAAMQKAALATDLVDTKVVTVNDEVYATRFVIRRALRIKAEQARGPAVG